MRLIYNYQNGDFAVSHNDHTKAVTTELDGATEMVYVFDIDHWTEDDFIYFTGLHADDQAELLERLNCISDTPFR
jgi:hypothetical protein